LNVYVFTAIKISGIRLITSWTLQHTSYSPPALFETASKARAIATCAVYLTRIAADTKARETVGIYRKI